ncbi:carbohydrate ABC transporter permease [Devosia sp.]|uniref:carbohydrate ABC transporter permease n=1 Tax=Devosia sp. TaxID=1871048 RepID=UPI0035B032CA
MSDAVESRASKAAKRFALTALTFLLMMVMCVPGLWVILSAFRPNAEILSKPPIWVPERLTLDNFAKIFGFGSDQIAIPVVSYFTNSLVIALTSTAIALLIGMAGGYAFARFRFRGKAGIFLGLMLFRAVPGIALSLPVFMLWSWMGLIDTQLGLIIVYVSLNVPFTIWLIDGFFRQIPMSLSEAAQVDGCTAWQAFWKIEFPLARSGIAAAGVFAFLTSWNEYALASQLTRSTDSKTLPVGLLDFTAQFTIDWAGMCAMAVIIIIPALILTFLVQKHLIAGLTFGGVKG